MFKQPLFCKQYEAFPVKLKSENKKKKEEGYIKASIKASEFLRVQDS